jgi:glycosyltransferase involved in cell wall biosynthesis
MNILLPIHSFSKGMGGSELHTLAIAREMKSKGSIVHIVYVKPHDGRKSLAHEFLDGIHLHQIKVPIIKRFEDYIYNVEVYPFFYSLIKALKIDIVHFQHLINLTLSAVEASINAKVPSFLTVRDLWMLCHRYHFVNRNHKYCDGPVYNSCIECVGPSSSVGVQNEMENFLLNRVNQFRLGVGFFKGVIFPSKFMYDIHNEYGFEHRSAIVLPHGIRSFTPKPWYSNEKHVRFLFLGNIYPTKGLDVLLKAIDLLNNNTCVLNIYGNIVDINYFETLKKQFGSNVHYLGNYQLHDLPDIFSKHDVCIVPSRFESFSHVLREAFHAKVPVIASHVGGLPEGIADGENGFLFRSEDYQHLAHLMSRFLEDKNLVLTCKKKIPIIKGISEYVKELEIIYNNF